MSVGRKIAGVSRNSKASPGADANELFRTGSVSSRRRKWTDSIRRRSTAQPMRCPTTVDGRHKRSSSDTPDLLAANQRTDIFFENGTNVQGCSTPNPELVQKLRWLFKKKEKAIVHQPSFRVDKHLLTLNMDAFRSLFLCRKLLIKINNWEQIPTALPSFEFHAGQISTPVEFSVYDAHTGAVLFQVDASATEIALFTNSKGPYRTKLLAIVLSDYVVESNGSKAAENVIASVHHPDLYGSVYSVSRPKFQGEPKRYNVYDEVADETTRLISAVQKTTVSYRLLKSAGRIAAHQRNYYYTVFNRFHRRLAKLQPPVVLNPLHKHSFGDGNGGEDLLRVAFSRGQTMENRERIATLVMALMMVARGSCGILWRMMNIRRQNRQAERQLHKSASCSAFDGE